MQFVAICIKLEGNILSSQKEVKEQIQNHISHMCNLKTQSRGATKVAK